MWHHACIYTTFDRGFLLAFTGDLLVSIAPDGEEGGPTDGGKDVPPATKDEADPREEDDTRAGNGASRAKTSDSADETDSNPVLAS